VPGFVSDASLNRYLPLGTGDLLFHVDGALVDGIGTVVFAQGRENVERQRNGGRTWRTVAGVGPATSILLPAGSLRGTDNGRLRVTVSDGLRRTSAVSGRIRVVVGRRRSPC
jgi:hypothetical protein